MKEITFLYIEKLKIVPAMIAHCIVAIAKSKYNRGLAFDKRIVKAQKITFWMLLKYGYMRKTAGLTHMTMKGIKRNLYHSREGGEGTLKMKEYFKMVEYLERKAK